MPHEAFDVVCVGGGGAGVSAAIAAARKGVRVALLSKEPVGYGNTRISFGIKTHPGIVTDDSVEVLYQDMLRGGEHLNDPRLARVAADEALLASSVLESYGHLFRRDEDGRLSEKILRRSGGHSLARSIMPHGYGGVPLGQALRAAAARTGIRIIEEVAVTRLLVEGGRVRGIALVHLRDGRLEALGANTVVLATGGAGWLYYPHTDCLRTSTGDGYGLALDAGASLVDMEQVQFIPFGLTHPRSMLGLFVGEPSLAGRHGRLLDRHGDVVATGVDVMTRAQVATIVSRAIDSGRGAAHGGLLLDLAPNFQGEDGRRALARAQKTPNFQIIRRAYGRRAFTCEDPWEVLPSAHFTMGGIVIDEQGRTEVDGLYAAGEAAGGIHGGNRLSSMALSDMVTFGVRAGEDAAAYARGSDAPVVRRDDLDPDREQMARWDARPEGARPIRLVRRLQRVMWEQVGLLRDEVKGQQAVQAIARLDEERETVGFRIRAGYNTDLQDAVELRLMLKAARAVALSALLRRESRGAHARSDYPDRDDEGWLANIRVRLTGTAFETIVHPVPRPARASA